MKNSFFPRVVRKMLLLFIPVLLFFTSCKKQQVESQPHSGKIKTITYKHSSWQGVTIQNFIYDLDNRVTHVYLYHRESDGDSIPIKQLEFIYSGNSVLPVSIHEEESAGRFQHTLVYNTSNTAIKINTSQIQSPANVLSYSEWNYTGNTRTGVYYSSSVHPDNIDSTVIVADNIVLHKVHFVGGTGAKVTSQFEYDNKINPIYQLNIMPVMHTMDTYSNSFLLGHLIISRNNLVKISNYGDYGTSVSGHMAYEYDNRDMPVKMVEDLGFGDTSVVEYYYY